MGDEAFLDPSHQFPLLLLRDFAGDFLRNGTVPHILAVGLSCWEAGASCCLADGFAALSYPPGCSVCSILGGRAGPQHLAVARSLAEVSLILLCPLEPYDWSSVPWGQLLSLSAAPCCSVIVVASRGREWSLFVPFIRKLLSPCNSHSFILKLFSV